MMRIILAPMEGVIDHILRDMLTRLGSIDLCLTEFVRITDQALPPRVYYRLCPELYAGSKTPSGTPVRIQLLGQDPNWLAENAVVATRLGSPGIDLNFGCPAKLVNRNKGGAILLQEPETLFKIMKSVREAVPEHLPTTAKMRLGYNDATLAIENAQALAEGGATEIAIHARTKSDGYKPPAYWPWIKTIKEKVQCNIIANGEIWSPSDATECRIQSGCQDLMLGRGALAIPNLPSWIKNQTEKMTWGELINFLLSYTHYTIEGDQGLYHANRIKQWFAYIRLQYPQANEFFRSIRTINDRNELIKVMSRELDSVNVQQ